MHNIIIVGTDPPCPRCGLLTEVVTRFVKELNIEAKISHLAFTDPLALKIAEGYGLRPGTAKNVAKAIGPERPMESFLRSMDDIESLFKENLEPKFSDLERLVNEVAVLDYKIKPIEDMAISYGFMMTPVLIINGEKKHQGSVPDFHSIEKWLRELKD